VDQDPPAEFDTANIHLQILGEECLFALQVPLGRRRLLELLPAARELTHKATAIAIRKARQQGKEISCKAGCGICCRQLVAISVVEAQAIADVVAALPYNRQDVILERFASAILHLEQAKLLNPQHRRGHRGLIAHGAGERRTLIDEVSKRYFKLQIPCPFLEDESCSIYPDRPLVCREYHVTSSAEHCAALYQSPVEKVDLPLHMGDVLASTVARFTGIRDQTIPLILALEWVESQEDKLNQPHDGKEMFMSLLSAIDHENQQPFEKRQAAHI